MFKIPAHKNTEAPAGQVVNPIPALQLVVSNDNPKPARRPMDPLLAAGIAEGWEDALDRDEEIAAWQYLHDTGLAYRLQGWFGRTAKSLLDAGVIKDKGRG